MKCNSRATGARRLLSPCPAREEPEARNGTLILPDSAITSEHALCMRRFIEGFLSGHHHDAGTIWRLYAVDQWARAYAVTGI